jgi:hypothetical protein
MSKVPKDLPEVGDIVKLRSNQAIGILRSYNKINWCIVDWAIINSGPKLCHRFELEKCKLTPKD